MQFFKNILKKIKENLFQAILVSALLIITILSLFFNREDIVNIDKKLGDDSTIYVFVQESCHYCHIFKKYRTCGLSSSFVLNLSPKI